MVSGVNQGEETAGTQTLPNMADVVFGITNLM